MTTHRADDRGPRPLSSTSEGSPTVEPALQPADVTAFTETVLHASAMA